MRFGNSSNYFGLQSNIPGWMALNTATGTAFHAMSNGCPGRLQTLLPLAGFSANSAVALGSKVTKDLCGDGCPFDFAQGLP